jgi:glycosyltransferase involved in cell wall biosynthesis
MRLLLSSTHKYPAFREVGSGLHPTPFPSGSGFVIHDLLVKGLAALGHEVLYLLPEGADKPLPEGARLVSEPYVEVDLVHTIAGRDEVLAQQRQSRCEPWVATCHLNLTTLGSGRESAPKNWIFVSRTMAELHGRGRYVRNGIDPSEYIFSESKDDYFLFMSAMYWGDRKGLDLALSLSSQMGFKLVVAGTDGNYETINRVAERCATVGATYVGDVRGNQKAELLAGAKGFLFPTKLDEAFGLVMAEALMSGTPVICSDRGACPEIISSDVGFVCKNGDDYVTAINDIATISSTACRDKAMKDYHYMRMAADYVVEYQKEIDGNGR